MREFLELLGWWPYIAASACAVAFFLVGAWPYEDLIPRNRKGRI